MMGPGFGAAAGAYLLIRPALILAAICVAIGFFIGWIL